MIGGNEEDNVEAYLDSILNPSGGNDVAAKIAAGIENAAVIIEGKLGAQTTSEADEGNIPFGDEKEDKPKRRGRKSCGDAGAGAANPTSGGGGGRKRLNKNDPLGFVPTNHLFVTSQGETYAKILFEDHYENWPIESRQFRRWLARQIRKRLKIVPNSQALQEIIQQFDAMAYEEGHRQDFWLRIGRHNGNLYIDLADDLWRVVEITSFGWNIIDGEPFFFRRTASSQRLCIPEAGYTVNEIRTFANFASDDDFVLFIGFVVAALRDSGPYPVLFINGEHGSGKSGLSKLLSDLINPSKPQIQSMSRDLRDLIVAVENSHAIIIDNASFIDAQFSDLICSLATGVGYRVRALRTDKEEFIFNGARPIAINGIPSLVERADLMSRAIIVQLDLIPDKKRLTERALKSAWEIAWPRVMGAIFDALSAALRNIESVVLDHPSRMADVEEWLAAAEKGLDWEPGTFSAAFRRNQKDAGDAAFEADIVAVAIRDWFDRDDQQYWSGTVTSLLGILETIVSENTRQLKSWPKTNQALGNAILRSKSVLRRKGIIVEKQHSGDRKVIITRAEATS